MKASQSGNLYGFVRARQLEGTYPGDKRMGNWPISTLRVMYGWGDPPHDAWPRTNDWPPTEPAGIDLLAKQGRIPPYRRVRTIAECRALLGGGTPVMVSLDITDKWACPPRGRIAAPTAGDIRLPPHSVMLCGYDRKRLKFINSWGEGWGDRGYGYITDKALEATWWEAWVVIPSRLAPARLSGIFPQPRSGAFTVADGSTLHWLEIVGKEDERLAWVSALETRATFEVEELFVRPAYRGRGFGRKLIQTVIKMAKDRHSAVRFYISFADAAPHSLEQIEATARSNGLTMQASGVRWAPLVVARPTPATEQIPSFPYPEHPPSIPLDSVIFAATVLTGLGINMLSGVIQDVLKSWLDPVNGRRIRFRQGDVELETSQLSVDEFLKLAKELVPLKDQAEIRSTILRAGITISVVKR